MRPASCPQCGASLNLLPGVLAVRCLHCGRIHLAEEHVGPSHGYPAQIRTEQVTREEGIPTQVGAHMLPRLPARPPVADPPPPSALDRYEALHAERERLELRLKSNLLTPGCLPLFAFTAGSILSVVLASSVSETLGWILFAAVLWSTWLSDRPRRRLVRAREEVDARLAGLRNALPHHPALEED